MIAFQKNYYLYIKDKNMLYCAIPKNACTSIKSWLQALLGLPTDVNPQIDPNIIKLLLSNYSDEEALRLLQSDKLFKFVFVRNPWTRVVSAFINKFLSYQQHLYVYMKGHESVSIAEFHANYHEKFVANVIGILCPDDDSKIHGISFRDFLNYLMESDDSDLNPHWKPQHRFIEGIDIDYVGKVEAITQDFTRIQTAAGFYSPLPVKNTTRYNSSNGESLVDTPCSLLIGKGFGYDSFYDDTTIAMVDSRYGTDISMFGYEYQPDG